MNDQTGKALSTLSTVNVAIWAIAIIGMVFLMQEAPGVKKLFPILAAGTGTGVSLIAAIAKARNSG